MKVVVALLLTLVTLSTAVPSPNDINPAILSARQECVYSCGCQVDNDGEGTDPDTAPCCASVGGILGNGDTVRHVVLGLIPCPAARRKRLILDV